MKLTFLDFFGGAGGWACGLMMAGMSHLGLFDHDEAACRTADFNLGGPIFRTDLRHFTPDPKTLYADIIVGSPPCQGFSNEGYKRKGDPRNSLVWKFLDFVEALSPKIWIFENVPGFQRLYKGVYYEGLKERLDNMPYHWKPFMLDSSHYGVPQRRIRFFVVGAKDFKPTMPEETHSDSENLFIVPARKKITLWDAISDLPKVEIGERSGIFDYDKSPQNDYQRWIREGSEKIYNHTTQRHSARILEKIRSVPSGRGMEVFVNDYDENKVVYCGGYRRAVKDSPSYTAYWTRGMTSIHPEQDRFLSPRECARIQSFPDRYIFKGTTIQNYTQICNAVPPLVGRAFGRYVIKILTGDSIPAVPWEPFEATPQKRILENDVGLKV